jgi:lipopolysaccharide exporter
MNEQRPVKGGATPPLDLGRRAVRGFSWMFLVSVWGKVQGTLVQVALAWFLSKEDFGQIGLAYTVTAFANVVVNPGLSSVLVQRARNLRYWSTPAFWMSLTCGILGAALMLAAAPIGAQMYGAPNLVGLVTVLAIAAPIGSLGMLPNALLTGQLKFKFLALLTLGAGILTGLLTVLLAALDFGAYSFVLPRPIVNTAQTLAAWIAARPKVRMKPQFRRWKYLVGNAGWMLVYLVCWTAIMQGDYIVLGYLFEPALVGTYFFGFNLAMQGARFIGGNVHTVLYPSLVALGTNRLRQAQVVLETSRNLALTVGCVSLLQAVLAEPVLHLVFGHRWDDAIPIVQLLSIGVVFESLSSPGCLLLMARGLFKSFALIYVLALSVFLPTVLLGARLGEGVGVSAAVACYYFLFWTPTYCTVMRSAGVPLRITTFMFLSVIVSGVASATLGFGLTSLLPSSESGIWLRTATLLLVTPAAYYAGMWLLQPQACRAALARVRQFRT